MPIPVVSIQSIVIFYGHVASNIGDVAINQGEYHLLKKAFPHASIKSVLWTATTSKYKNMALSSIGETAQASFFKVSSYKGFRYLSAPDEFLKDHGAEEADLIVLSSGEHLFSYQENLNKRNLFWRLLPALAAKLCQKKCVLMPSTLGPFEDTLSQNLIDLFLTSIDLWAPREALTSKQLLSLKASVPDARLDPAFFLLPPSSDTTKTVNHLPEGHIAFSMRQENIGIRLDEMQTQKLSRFGFDVFYQTCQKILEQTNQDIVLYIQTDSDRDLVEEVIQKITTEENQHRIFSYRPTSIENYLLCLQKSSSVITGRFHTVIFSLILGKKVYAVYHNNHGHKMPGLFKMINKDDHCFKLTPDTITDIPELFVEGLHNKNEKSTLLPEKLETLKAETLSWLKEIDTENQKPKLEELYRFHHQLHKLIADSLEEEIQHKFSDSKKYRRYLSTKKEKEKKLAQQHRREIISAVEKIKNSHSYKIGHLITKIVKFPARFFFRN
ncbi:MAG: polysaccharide pyruvyl transferase family protein [Bdellovibrionota bacterium]